MFPALLRCSAALYVGTNPIWEQLYNPLSALPQKPAGKDGVTVRMSPPLPSSLKLLYFPHCKAPILLALWQLSHHPCFLSKHGDQSFLTSIINPFSPLCCLAVSAIPPHLNTDREKVKFQHSYSSSNCKTFRAVLFSPHHAFTQKEAQLFWFQTSLEKFEMLKWQTNVQHKDPKGRYSAL